MHNAGGVASCNLGKRGEAEWQQITGLVKNAKSFRVGTRTRIPDGWQSQIRHVHEVKNIRYQYLRARSRMICGIAGSGGRAHVWVASHTRVSRTLANHSRITVRRMTRV
ncbi:hypothetical protein FIC82_017985 [Cellulosimicrobium protaetiae]|uniref:Tox-REase-7 domain-containing protein n=1 Tax=Cellulosimicrobium protaetiae TaxID=2587808 RepID=A0A6M5UI41_9MICO|nr:hypothetical protein FIC82_017985 [Cellulosimicrobium protaetiae]